MAAEKLTKRTVDSFKAPKPSKVGVKVRETFVWDKELRGFGVQVMPSGLKSFVIQFRTTEGRLRRVGHRSLRLDDSRGGPRPRP